MAVAKDATATGTTHGTTGTTANLSLTVTGSNPVIFATVDLLHATAVSTTPSWSLGSGTPVMVKSVRGGSGNATYCSVWAIPAPATGAGTLTLNWDTSINWAISADSFTGADQTTPSPTGDAQSDTTADSSHNLTPTNLTANDATYGGCAESADNVTGVSGTGGSTTLTDNAGSVGIGTGYALGTAAITFTTSAASNSKGRVAVRIVAAAAATPAQPIFPMRRGSVRKAQKRRRPV